MSQIANSGRTGISRNSQQLTPTSGRKSNSKETSGLSSLSQIMMLQRTAGNRAVSQIVQNNLQQSGQDPVIQRSLDDKAKKKWKNVDLSALWLKMRNRSEGKEEIPAYGAVQANMATFIDQEHTERELAEIIMNTPPFKAMFLSPRLAQADDEITKPEGSDEKAVEAVLAACIFYHVTFSEYVDAITEGGIKASKGGKGAGVSTFGRDDPDANVTYNKWSKGHTFITKSNAEAQGYKSSMEKDGKTAKIMHIFSTPSFTKSEMKVDIDSKAGLKYEGDLRAVGNRTELNQAALSLTQSALMQMKVTVDASTINDIYRRKYGA